MGKLDGKVALITGSGRNIGRALALRFAEEGADVVVNARSNKQEAEGVAREVRDRGRRAIAVLADVAIEEQVGAMVAKGLETFGRIDILVSNASFRPSKAFHEITLDEWVAVRSIDLDGAFFISRAVIPSMLAHGYGRMVFMLGDSAFIGGAKRTHTSAAKMGVVGLARGIASEYITQNVTANVLSPLSIDTARREGTSAALNDPSGIPMGRRGKIDEVVAAGLFLASDECLFMTGQTLHMNGGAAFF